MVDPLMPKSSINVNRGGLSIVKEEGSVEYEA